MTKKLISILLSIIILFGTFVCTFAQEEKATNFVVTSDLHYVSPCENKEDYLYAETFSLNKDGKKLQNESSFIIDAFLEQCKADIECDFILVSGDLVSYGRDYATEHEALAQKFASFEEETGKQVYVINGNHDNGASKATDSKRFKEIYNNFGYESAFMVADDCCSYATNLDEKYGLIALDSCDENYALANGIDSTRLNFVKEAARKIKSSGRYPILIMHHNLLEHIPAQLAIMDKYIVSFPRTYGSMFADWGIKLVFTGHTHFGNATSHTSPLGNVVYDFSNPSFVDYTSQYRKFSLTDSKIIYKDEYIQKIDAAALGARVNGYTQEELNLLATDYQKFNYDFFKNVALIDIKKTITEIDIPGLRGVIEKAIPLFDMSLYGENSLQKLAEENKINIPDSNYINVWDVATEIFIGFSNGDRRFHHDSLEAKIAYGVLKLAFKQANGVGVDISPIAGLALESFLSDNDGVPNLAGTLEGYGVNNKMANIFNAISLFFKNFIKIFSVIF